MTEDDVSFQIRDVEPRTLHELRRRVLRGDDPASSVQDARDDDVTSHHFAGFLADRLVVSASFFLAPAPVNPELTSYQLRYMATDFDIQGLGYGAQVLEHAGRTLRSEGATQLWAYARDSALGFYQRVGWSILKGSEHISTETKLPHTVIFKPLGDARDHLA